MDYKIARKCQFKLVQQSKALVAYQMHPWLQNSVDFHERPFPEDSKLCDITTKPDDPNIIMLESLSTLPKHMIQCLQFLN